MSAVSPASARSHASPLLLMAVAFFGVFIYGLLAALPGSVLPTLERNQYLPNDKAVGTFLLINAIGAVLAYFVGGPIIDRAGKKIALALGALMVIASLVGFAFIVTSISAAAALTLIFVCSLLLGFGSNAIVAAGHALVADVASSWRNAALNLLDICFGLGLAALPLVVQSMQARGGIGIVFWTLAGLSIALLIAVLIPRYPVAAHTETVTRGAATDLLRNPSFWLLALALFMYVGAEVSVGKWVVTFMQRDPQILAASGIDAARLQTLSSTSPAALSQFFEQDTAGVAVATFALRSLSYFAFALLAGRLVSSLLLGIVKINSFLLLTLGSLLTVIGLAVTFTANVPGTVRLGLVIAGFGMGPIFPTSVGLASTMLPRVAGTAMSLVMGIGFAGLLVIPPAVGYISDAVGGANGDIRTGLLAVLGATILMLFLHIALTLRERRRPVVDGETIGMQASSAD